MMVNMETELTLLSDFVNATFSPFVQNGNTVMLR